MKQRTQKHRDVPLNSKGKSLLVGRVFCGHCGNRLTLTSCGRKRKMADGSSKYETRFRYNCHYRVRHPGECDGQSGYGVTKLDAVVEKIIRMKFSEMSTINESELLLDQQDKAIKLALSKYELAKANYQSKYSEMDELRSETIKVIRGQSKLNAELLNSLVAESEVAVKEADAALAHAKDELEMCKATSKNIKQEYDRILSWAELYDQSSFEAKKMIISQFIKAIRVYKDYSIEVDFNVSFEDFQSYKATEDEVVKKESDVEPAEEYIVHALSMQMGKPV